MHLYAISLHTILGDYTHATRTSKSKNRFFQEGYDDAVGPFESLKMTIDEVCMLCIFDHIWIPFSFKVPEGSAMS